MRTTTLLCSCMLAALTAGLCGCAEYRVVEKCGFHGCPGDAQISSQVRALLDQHPALGPPNQIYVRTLDGVVYLSGQVATGLQRDTAAQVARQASGVRRVADLIALPYEGR
jgi:osmotically-inducible protein OsmY